MTDRMTLRELLEPCCPLGTADRLILDWVQKDTLFRVKEVESGYYLDIAPQLVNYRLVTTPVENESSWVRGWCYAGRGRHSFVAAVLAAALWDGSDHTEPTGWNKSLQTREWREPGEPQTWQTSRGVLVLHAALDQERAWPPKV